MDFGLFEAQEDVFKEEALTSGQKVWDKESKSIRRRRPRSWDLSLHLSGGRRGKEEVWSLLAYRGKE